MKYSSLVFAAVMLLLGGTQVHAECLSPPSSGRLLYNCFVADSLYLNLYKEFLGAGKRRYVLTVNTSEGSPSCNSIANAEKTVENSREKFKFKKISLTLKKCRTSRGCFKGSLKGSAEFPLLNDLLNQSGKLDLKDIDCVQHNKER